jgi:polysaccharide biosynthesis transport protein
MDRMDDNRQLSLDRMVGDQQDEAELFSPYDILSMLGRRFYWLLITTTILFGLASEVAIRWPDEYKAETMILVDPQKVPERYVNTTVSMDVSGRLSTINQQLMSSTRLQRIIDTYDLYKQLKGHKTQEEIIEQMRSDVHVEIVRNFEAGAQNKSLGAFKIVYVGRSASLVAQVCNQLASLFIEENLKVREQQAEGTSEFIDTRLDYAKKSLEDQETKLRDFKMKNMGQLPEQAAQNIAQLNGLEQQLRSETETINHLRQQQTFVTSQINSIMQMQQMSSSATPVALGESTSSLAGPPAPTSELLARLKARKTEFTTLLEQARQHFTEQHPDVVKFKGQIKQLDKDIDTEEKRLAAAPPPPMITGLGGMSGKTDDPSSDAKDPLTIYRSQLKVIDQEVAQRSKNQEVFESQVKVLRERLENMPMREQEMAQTDRDVALLRENYKSLLEKKMSADMAADLEKRQKSERFTILDPARIPEKPFRPVRWQILVGSFAAGMGLGFLMIFITEMRDKSLKKEDELTRMGLRILGRIPMVVTSEEAQMTRRRKMRNWALGTVATMTVLGVMSVVQYFVTKYIFML